MVRKWSYERFLRPPAHRLRLVSHLTTKVINQEYLNYTINVLQHPLVIGLSRSVRVDHEMMVIH